LQNKREKNTILKFAATTLNHEIAKHCLTKIEMSITYEIVLKHPIKEL
jgi:hypothetical protein